jgi:Ca-activated chloride channel family protein
MRFGIENPAILLLGPLLLLAGLRASRHFRELLSLEEPLGPPGGTSFKAPPGAEALVKALRVLEYAGIMLLAAAAAGPRLMIPEPFWLDSGAEIIFVLDLSPSMAGLDMDGKSRCDAARSLVSDFARRRPSDAIGLIGVGSEAALLLPPTADREALYRCIAALRIGELGDGTALGLGLASAALHLRGSTAPRRAAVLITDGENNAGAVHPETAAGALRDSGASLWVVGLGSPGDVPIDYVDPFSGIRRRGILESRYDPEALRAIARKGGGTYLSAPSAASFEAALDRVDEAEFTVRRSATLNRERSLRSPALLAALFCILLARFLRRGYGGALL